MKQVLALCGLLTIALSLSAISPSPVKETADCHGPRCRAAASNVELAECHGVKCIISGTIAV